MNIRKILQQMACLVLVMSFLVGCKTPKATSTRLPVATPLRDPTDIPTELTTSQGEQTATPVPKTKNQNLTSCQEVEGACLELSFDGEICAYKGPTEIKSGAVTLLFLN